MIKKALFFSFNAEKFIGKNNLISKKFNFFLKKNNFVFNKQKFMFLNKTIENFEDLEELSPKSLEFQKQEKNFSSRLNAKSIKEVFFIIK